MPNYMRRLGFIQPEATKSILILKGDVAAAEQASALVRLVRERYPRTPAFLLSRDGVADPNCVVYPYPFSIRLVERRFLKRSRAKLLIVAGGFRSVSSSLIEEAVRRGCDILVLVRDDRDQAELNVVPWRQHVTRTLCVGVSTGEGLEAIDLRAMEAEDVQALLDTILPYLTESRRQKLKLIRQSTFRHSWISRLPRLPFLGPMLSRKFKRVETLADLKVQLGSLQTILCLGNGPSSERPELDGVNYDRLFRVNESWKARGRFAAPDLVFTSLAAAVKLLRPRIGFIFKNQEDEATIRSVFALTPRVIRYGVATRLDVYDQAYFGPYSPTNGAVMLALAVALKPAHLVVAGIDLYAHPEGAYPQDGTTVNDYSVGHDRLLEANFLLALLQAFEGKLTILSPALAQAFDEHRAALRE